ncbi:MAG: hypothetical protein VB013_03050 [Anaerolineaceae bacterium]|nr:hypothetical protein [Anaerolineaceae bacterium]
MTQYLRNSEPTLMRFIEESKISLSQDCGFSSILTLFSVILVVGESLLPKNKDVSDYQCIESFLREVTDFTWLKKVNGSFLSTEETIQLITEVRNGLTHDISLPQGVILVKDSSNVSKLFASEDKNKFDYAINIESFINSIRYTIVRIIHDNRFNNCEMDQNFIYLNYVTKSRKVATSSQEFSLSTNAIISGSYVQNSHPVSTRKI